MRVNFIFMRAGLAIKRVHAGIADRGNGVRARLAVKRVRVRGCEEKGCFSPPRSRGIVVGRIK